MTEGSLLTEINVGSAATAALSYSTLGWEPLRLRSGDKRPLDKKPKERRDWTAAEIEQEFTAAVNVGLYLGSRSSGLIDIDFDCREAAELAKIVLPDLPSFGRASAPNSHRIAKAKLKKGKLPFDMGKSVAEILGADRSMLLEVRGNGHQTMFPPSVHPSGEVVQWHDDPKSVPALDGAELAQKCGLIAALSAIAMAYPKVKGERDDVCLMLTGVLVRAGLSDAEIDVLVPEVARLAGDEEAEDRSGKAASSRVRIESGEPVWGLPELCKRLGLEALEPKLRAWLRLGHAVPDDPRPSILVRPGNIPAEVDQIEAALLAGGFGIYQRGGSLVRIVRLPFSVGEDGVQRASGIILLQEIQTPWLLEKFALAARWFKPGEDDLVAINPPSSHATQLLARTGEWRAPVLHGVVSTPTMRKDGSVLQTAGYDPQSGLLFEPNGVEFPLVPDHPTKRDAAAALERLALPFREFRFPTKADRSVVLATILTSLIRRNLPSAPLTAIDAPTAGSGKSLLAETIGIIAAGHKPTMLSQGKSAEEDEKRLSSVLMAGDPVLVIDNCERPLAGDTLCSTLTQEFLAARILGKSEVVRMPTNALIMATGNNLEVIGDLARRTLVTRIDTGEERPDRIEHDFNPGVEAMSDRAELVVAGLTVLRAYIAAGRPNRIVPMGSFEDWNVVREALVWLGEEDPIITRERVIADDPRKGDLAELLEIWSDAFGGQTVTLADIEKRHRAADPVVRQICDALISRSHKDQFNTRSIGRHLSKQKDRPAGGKVLRCLDSPSGVKRYRVETLGDASTTETPF